MIANDFVLIPRSFHPDLSDTKNYPDDGTGIGKYRLCLGENGGYTVNHHCFIADPDELAIVCGTIPTPRIRAYRHAPTEKMRHILRVVACYNMTAYACDYGGGHRRPFDWYVPSMNYGIIMDSYAAYRDNFINIVKTYRNMFQMENVTPIPSVEYIVYARYMVFYDDATVDLGRGSLTNLSRKMFNYPMKVYIAGAPIVDRKRIRNRR